MTATADTTASPATTSTASLSFPVHSFVAHLFFPTDEPGVTDLSQGTARLRRLQAEAGFTRWACRHCGAQNFSTDRPAGSGGAGGAGAGHLPHGRRAGKTCSACGQLKFTPGAGTGAAAFAAGGGAASAFATLEAAVTAAAALTGRDAVPTTATTAATPPHAAAQTEALLDDGSEPAEGTAESNAAQPTSPGGAGSGGEVGQHAHYGVVREDNDGVPRITLMVPDTTHDLALLGKALVHLMYNDCELLEGCGLTEVVHLLHVVSAYCVPAVVLPAVDALAMSLMRAYKSADVDSDTLQYILSDDFPCVIGTAVGKRRCGTCSCSYLYVHACCSCHLQPTVREYLDKSKVVSELAELTGWRCSLCNAANSKSISRCHKCGGPREATPTLGEQPSLVRMPSDLDPAFFVPPPQEQAALEALGPAQRAAVDYVVREARHKSNAARAPLLQRLEKLGYTERQLRRCLTFLRDEAPIIIHVSMTKALKFLVDDTHYRNQFETGTSGGSLSTPSRTSWENRLFNKLYEGAAPVDRCKYGVFNVINDPHG